MAQRQPKVRRRDFEQVELGFTASQAKAEAARCLQCASCCECLACAEVCGEVHAIDHMRTGSRVEIKPRPWFGPRRRAALARLTRR
jgi:heterodisulfide reductase subunit A